MQSKNTLYDDIKNISAQELGIFVKKIIVNFINKGSAFHGLVHESYDTEVQNINYCSSEVMRDVTLVYILGASKFNSVCKQYEKRFSSVILFNDDMSLVGKGKYERHSTEEFLEEKFALSTVLDDYELYCLDVLTFLKDIKLGTYGMTLQIPWVLEYYKECKKNNYYLLDKISNPDKIND